MKKLILINLVLFFPILMMAFSSPPPYTVSPIKGNWLNPMAGGAAEEFDKSRVYIYLDQDDELNVNVIVSTTDNDLDPYDNLHVAWSFGIYNGIEEVEEADLVEVSTGLYEATYLVNMSFAFQCTNDSDGVLPLDIVLSLKTEKEPGMFDDYPIDSNPGLFVPESYENFTTTFETSKFLLCWGTSVPIPFANNNDDKAIKNNRVDNTITNSPGTDLYQETQNLPSAKVETVSPNPFTDEFQISYYLESPSDIEIRLVDAKGQAIAVQKFVQQAAGTQSATFVLDNDSAPGIYAVQVYYADRVETIKLIKLKTTK